MTALTRLRDGFINLVNGLGSIKDPRLSTAYSMPTLDQAQLATAYRGNWLARRIVDSIPEDATREWRAWQANEEQIEKIENVEKSLNLQLKVKQALIRARLFGGAVLLMGVEVGDASEELDLEAVGQDDLKFVIPMSCNEMTAGTRIRDVTSPWYQRPEYYQISTAQTTFGSGDPFVQIHPSRVIEFVGAEIPDMSLAESTFTWGDSVIQIVDDVLKDFGMTISSIAAMVADSKMDVIKIPGLATNLSDPVYEKRLMDRLIAANAAKGVINSLLMDDKETWERVQTSFNGLNTLIQEFIKLASGAAGIPMTRLVGHGPGSGHGGSLGSGASGGESDLRNYYDDVTSKQKTEYAPRLAPLDEVLMRSALGTYDPSVYYEWNPLYKPDPKEIADISLVKAQASQAHVSMGLINPDVLREVVINQLVEDATFPGLQDAVDEFGAEPAEPATPSANDITNHLGMLQKSSQQLQQIGKQAQPMLPPKKVGDAGPRKFADLVEFLKQND